MKTLDVTLTGLTCEFTTDGEPVVVAGSLFAKTFTRGRVEKASSGLFATEGPVLIPAGESCAINRTVTMTLSTESSEIQTVGENLALGGDLGLGGARFLILPSYELQNVVLDPGDLGAGLGATVTGRNYALRYSTAEGQHLRADFVVKVMHFG